MKEKLKFNLTEEMSLELIKFNELKKKLYNLDKNDTKKIKELQKELDESRKRFIKQFRLSNKKEIIKYLNIKDQK